MDCHWPAARLVVELDGFEFHRDPLAFRRDRRRDARLQATGHRVLRLTADDVDRSPGATADLVRRMLAQAAPATAA